MIYFHTQKVEFILHRTRQKYYFESERPSHLLALRLKECDSKAYISAIKSLDDQVTTNPVTINDIFKGFYTNLYKAETDFDEPICKQYLDKLELPRISQIDIPSFIPIKESFIYLGITIYKNIHKIARDNFNNILVKGQKWHSKMEES